MSAPRFNGPLAAAAARTWNGILRHGRPDPWPAEVDAAVRDPAAVPLCVNCLQPQAGHHWFCPHCGGPTGEYVATMPYLYIFQQGEFFRRGVMGPPERRVGVLVFQALYAAANYSFFAPVYWFWMVRRAQGRPICVERRPVVRFEEAAE